jgi:hypothetical protein
MPIDPKKLIPDSTPEPMVITRLAFNDAEYEHFTNLLLQDDELYNEFRAAETRAKLSSPLKLEKD